MLARSPSNALSVVKDARRSPIAGIQGQASVQQVVEAVMSAEQTLQSAIAVRDKVVSRVSRNQPNGDLRIRT